MLRPPSMPECMQRPPARACAQEFEPQNSKESPFVGGIHVERGTRVCRPAAGSTGGDSRQPKYSDAPTCRARLRHSCRLARAGAWQPEGTRTARERACARAPRAQAPPRRRPEVAWPLVLQRRHRAPAHGAQRVHSPRCGSEPMRHALICYTSLCDFE